MKRELTKEDALKLLREYAPNIKFKEPERWTGISGNESYKVSAYSGGEVYIMIDGLSVIELLGTAIHTFPIAYTKKAIELELIDPII